MSIGKLFLIISPHIFHIKNILSLVMKDQVYNMFDINDLVKKYVYIVIY